MKTKEKFEFER